MTTIKAAGYIIQDKQEGGAIAWSHVGGIACTREEACE